MDLKSLESRALQLLREACTDFGIMASPEAQDNYRRLWSRDSMVAGIAAIPTGDEQVLEGFRQSILTLAEYQHPHGMIPSNLLPDEGHPDISYGGLAGRVDATSWFVVGACLLISHTSDEELKRKLQPNLLQALEIMDRWEFNGRGLIYTPLSGNWADEYPVQGHTLYDNCLRLWGLELYAKLYGDEDREVQARIIRERIEINFWPASAVSGHPAVYHKRSFEEMAEKELMHFACAVDPRGYNTHFDAAGHGLALYLGMANARQKEKIEAYTGKIFEEIGSGLLPAFWPVIMPENQEWLSLKENYSYEFKNKPHNFHNGGIWPVWMGFFGLGMSLAGNSNIAETMLNSWMEIENPKEPRFSEYIASDTLKPGGKQRLSYSASGLLFLIQATKHNNR